MKGALGRSLGSQAQHTHSLEDHTIHKHSQARNTQNKQTH